MSLADIKHIEPKRILDIGANNGHWAQEAKVLWPDAAILIIEGNQACCPYLDATGFPYITAYLGDQQREVQFFKRKGGGTDTGNSYYRELTSFFEEPEVQTVKLLPLTDLISEDRCFDLIKLDTQGSELDIIRGGLPIFKRAEHIVMEVAFAPYNEGAPLAPEVFSFMDHLGFPKCHAIGDIVHPLTREVIQKDILFSK